VKTPRTKRKIRIRRRRRLFFISEFKCEAPRPQGGASRQGFNILYCALAYPALAGRGTPRSDPRFFNMQLLPAPACRGQVRFATCNEIIPV
jgi:hypothetical protein